jgi:AraC-like DNA-binding protein
MLDGGSVHASSLVSGQCYDPCMEAYRELPANPSHSAWVECVWAFESTGPVLEHRVPPDGCLDIIYDRRLGLRAIGAMTKEQRFEYTENAYMAGIRFRPGMAGRFLGVPPPELTDVSAALTDLWPRRAGELERRLDDARSIQEAMRILLGGLAAPADPPNPVQNAISAIAAANGNADLDSVACRANLSSRQFRRRCLDESGLTPKRLCRVLRFRHVCRVAAAADERPKWSAIALEAGYFDQAHLIRDFQILTGLTPMAVFSNSRTRC